MNHLKQAFVKALPPIIAVVVLVAAWEAYVRLGGISPRMLAAPDDVVRSLIATWPTSLGEATAITAQEGLIGFGAAVVIGILLGVTLYASRTLNAALYPLLAAAQTLPIIAIAPLFLIWFGFETTGKSVMVALFAVFPIAIQTSRGLIAVPEFYTDVALTCGATRWWTLWHVRMRVAARQIFGGLRIAAAYVFATAATAEYLGAVNGLGIFLQSAYNSFRTPLIFAAALVIMGMTALLLVAISLVEFLMLGPRDDEDPDAQE